MFIVHPEVAMQRISSKSQALTLCVLSGQERRATAAFVARVLTGCEKSPKDFCHSERSEESLFLFMCLKQERFLAPLGITKLPILFAASSDTGFSYTLPTTLKRLPADRQFRFLTGDMSQKNWLGRLDSNQHRPH